MTFGRPGVPCRAVLYVASTDLKASVLRGLLAGGDRDCGSCPQPLGMGPLRVPPLCAWGGGRR